MSGYILDKNDIYQLIKMNFNLSFYWMSPYEKKGRSDAFIKDTKLHWNTLLLDNVLKKQPELEPIVEKFWKDFRTEQYISSLICSTFENKIYLQNIYSLIFNVHETYSGGQERKKFIKKMIHAEPWLMNELHKKIKNSNLIDSVLLSCYIELLPSCVKEIKDIKQSILNNIEKTRDFSENNTIQVLTSTIKSFSHDQELYTFLKDHFSSKFENFHSLRDKFKKFEIKYFSQFKDDQKIEIFNNSQEYKYIFYIKDSIMVDYFGIDKNNIVRIQLQIHDFIKNYLNNHVSADLHYSYSKKGFEISTSNFDYRPKIEFHMEKLNSCIKDVLSSLDEDTKKDINKEPLSKLFASAILKVELDNLLLQKEDCKSKKNKI